MEKTKNTYGIILIGIFFAILFTPSVIKILESEKPANLKGAFVEKEKPVFTLEDWLNITYQPKFSAWLEENIGGRPFLIRIYNQYLFYLYNSSTAPGLLIGKDLVLYQNGYYNAFMGDDFIGLNEMEDKANKTRFIQDKLSEKNIPFLFVFAPSKVSIYPEFIPDYKMNRKRGPTNHGGYKSIFDQKEINYIDFDAYFKGMKDTTTYPIFPKGGIHWSGYAVAHAADTIFRRLDQLSQFKLTSFDIKEGYSTKSDYVFTDNDLEEILNLVIPLEPWELNYPEIVFNKSNEKPKILIVGDSFSQSFHGFGPYYSTIFSASSRLWQAYEFGIWVTDSTKIFYQIDKANLAETVESFDMVLVLNTEINLSNIGLGFIDELHYSYLNSPSMEDKKYLNTETIGFLGFEDHDNQQYNQTNISKDRFYDGDGSNRLSANNIYSEGFVLNKTDFDMDSEDLYLKMSVRYWTDFMSETFENEAYLVLEIRDLASDLAVDYQAWSLSTPNSEAKNWNLKEIRFKKEAFLKDSYIKIYVYYTGKDQVFIDDFKVENKFN